MTKEKEKGNRIETERKEEKGETKRLRGRRRAEEWERKDREEEGE